MPSQHVLRQYPSSSFVHVYNRGVEKRSIFIDEQDRTVFYSLLKRYLDPFSNESDCDGVKYVSYSGEIELQCFCLMDNHYHFLVWIGENPALLSEFMRSLSNSYTSYFNKKYSRVGSLFEGRFKTTVVHGDEQLVHLSRYIHLNPPSPLLYEHTSVRSFLGIKHTDPSFLNPFRLKEILDDIDYRMFLDHAGINVA